ncbi:hypothetical protein CCR75_004267 [Bremia lactucae]|uniref:Elicitin n=1 Tax=Bremia lactucae TaxID=4779 RepID=A0A976IJV9_BRELC|nr:hypothetical protein CCR75_004267 [Bremia lactucae]
MNIFANSQFLILLMIAGRDSIYARPCTSTDLGVFNDVSNQVSQCRQDSQLNFLIPPHMSLTKTEQSALCKSKACQGMIGSMDDLDIPMCEATFDLKNMTLQMSLDKFVAACDTSTPAPSPMKRRKSLESSSFNDSDSKTRRYENVATAIQFGLPHQIVTYVAIGILSLGFLLD